MNDDSDEDFRYDSNEDFRSWPRRYEQGGWSTKRRRKTLAVGAKLERGYGQRRLRSFKSKVRLVALALVLLAACGLGLTWWLMREPEPVVVEAPAVQVTRDFSENATKERWVGPTPRKIVDAFLEAGSDEGRLKWVRDPEKVAADLKQWYAEGPGSREQVTKVTLLEAPRINSRLNLDAPYEHTRFFAHMKGGGKRLLSIVSTPDGGKLDFGCYIRQCSAPWSAILSGEVAEADVRVLVEADTYYNFNFIDDKQWRCFAISSPDLEERIHVYARPDLPGLREMPRGRRAEPLRMYLRIRQTSRENLARRQFELEKVIAQGWTE